MSSSLSRDVEARTCATCLDLAEELRRLGFDDSRPEGEHGVPRALGRLQARVIIAARALERHAAEAHPRKASLPDEVLAFLRQVQADLDTINSPRWRGTAPGLEALGATAREILGGWAP